MKNKLRLMYIGVTFISVLCIVFAFVLAKDFLMEFGLTQQQPSQDTQVENNVILYKEPKNPTELQKQIYEELLEATKAFPEEYDPFVVADCVVRSFVADFFTWTNKEGNFDVGGLDYVYGPNHLAFALYARDTFYQNFNFFEQEYGVENLIEVESIRTVVDYAAPVVIDEVEYPAYYVRVYWTYKENNVIDVTQFQDEAYYIAFYNQKIGRFELAETYQVN